MRKKHTNQTVVFYKSLSGNFSVGLYTTWRAHIHIKFLQATLLSNIMKKFSEYMKEYQNQLNKGNIEIY